MRVSLVLAAALAFVPAADAWTRLPLADQIASEIAGRPVEVRCAHHDEWTTMGGDPAWTGFTHFNDSGSPEYMAIAPNTCWSLLLLAADPDNWTASTLSLGNQAAVARQGEAVLTLAHEAVHMSGVRDEGETECRAMGHIDRVLAVFRVEIRRLEVRNLAVAAHRASPPDYQRVC